MRGRPALWKCKLVQVNHESRLELGMSVIQTSYGARVRLVSALIVLLILSSSLSQLRASLSRARQVQPISNFALYQQRFSEVRNLLPRGKVTTYADPLAKLCEPFVLAQYSVVPAILNTRRFECNPTSDIVDPGAPTTNLRLGNSLDAQQEPFLPNLFPEGEAILRSGTQTDLFPGEKLTLIKDTGNGIRLYSSGDGK